MIVIEGFRYTWSLPYSFLFTLVVCFVDENGFPYSFSSYRTFCTSERSVFSCEEYCRHCFLPVKYMSAIMSKRPRPESKGIFPFSRVLLMFSSSSLLNSGPSARLGAHFVLAIALDAFYFIRGISCSWHLLFHWISSNSWIYEHLFFDNRGPLLFPVVLIIQLF